MKLHAFVAMPFGSKPGPDGQVINFNRIYDELIRPALQAARLEVVGADEEERAGDIRTDMFQELLIADLVIVDLTGDNCTSGIHPGTVGVLRVRIATPQLEDNASRKLQRMTSPFIQD